MEVAVKLYDAFDGEGLARFDIRMDAATGKLMVLDVNPNCSLVRDDAHSERDTQWLSSSDGLLIFLFACLWLVAFVAVR